MLAQKTSGGIIGQATDASGASVANATITLFNASTGVNRTTHTNNQGEYTFDAVAIGTYELDVTAPSFQKEVLKDVVVNVATTTRTDIHLAPGSLNETMTVIANAIQVQTDSGALGNIIDGTQVKELPLNGRSFVELTQLGPGVSEPTTSTARTRVSRAASTFRLMAIRLRTISSWLTAPMTTT